MVEQWRIDEIDAAHALVSDVGISDAVRARRLVDWAEIVGLGKEVDIDCLESVAEDAIRAARADERALILRALSECDGLGSQAEAVALVAGLP